MIEKVLIGLGDELDLTQLALSEFGTTRLALLNIAVCEQRFLLHA